MITKKKIIALVLSVVAICSLAGCGNKEETKTEQSNNEVVSQETENNIYGIWVVEKYEVYEGPLKDYFEEIGKQCYYQGAEYEFTEDGYMIFCKDPSLITSFELISNNQMKITPVIGEGNSNSIDDYELNGNSLIIYSRYDDYEKYGRTGAVYFKRK